MDIKVLGIGCAKCKKLYEEVEKAIREVDTNATLTKVEKLDEIISYRVLMTPALVINGEVKSAGRIPPYSEIAGWITTAAEEKQG